MRKTPLNERYLLSIREAADYFGIGEKKTVAFSGRQSDR